LNPIAYNNIRSNDSIRSNLVKVPVKPPAQKAIAKDRVTAIAIKITVAITGLIPQNFLFLNNIISRKY